MKLEYLTQEELAEIEKRVDEKIAANPKLQLLHKLQDIVNSREYLWREVGKFMASREYIDILSETECSMYDRMLIELDFLERLLGPTMQIVDLRKEIKEQMEREDGNG